MQYILILPPPAAPHSSSSRSCSLSSCSFFLSLSCFQAKQKARNKIRILQKRKKKNHKNKSWQKPNKKRKPKQNERKRAQKYHRVHLGLANSGWAWSLPWVLVDKPSDTSLGKTGFPFASMCQLQQVGLWIWVWAETERDKTRFDRLMETGICQKGDKEQESHHRGTRFVLERVFLGRGVTAFFDTLMRVLNPSPKVESVFVKAAIPFKELEVRGEHAGAAAGVVLRLSTVWALQGESHSQIPSPAALPLSPSPPSFLALSLPPYAGLWNPLFILSSLPHFPPLVSFPSVF